MPNYIVYRLNETGRIRGSEWIGAVDDEDALLLARALLPGISSEVWQRDRRVGRLGCALRRQGAARP